MKIYHDPGMNQVNNVQDSQKPGNVQNKEKAPVKDQVEFSSELQKIKAQEVNGSSDSQRRAKVQGLKEQIAEGTYQPDLHKVAASLLKFIVREGQ